MNMNQPAPQEQPKVEELSKNQEFTLQENGDVILIEKVETKVTFKARQFISYKRQHETGIEEIKKQLSKEHLEELTKHKTKLENLLKPLIPICEKVDKIVQEKYLKQQKETTINQLKQLLNQKEKETNPQVLGVLWSQVPKEHKEEILKALTKEEQTKLLNLKLDKMKTERGKK